MFQSPSQEIKYETHHRVSIMNPPSQSYYVQNNHQSQQIQYLPGRNAQYIQNPNINNDIAYGAHQFIESMYAPPIVNTIPKSKLIIEDIQYYPPDTSRPLKTVIPQIPMSPPILPVNTQLGRNPNLQNYQKTCSCCPFGQSSVSQISVSQCSQCSCCPYPQSMSQQAKCGCSPGFNLSKLPRFNHNPYYGYHGVGYEMAGQKCCDGIGGYFYPNRPTSLCLGCSSNPNTQIGIPNISSQTNRCCFLNCKKCF